MFSTRLSKNKQPKSHFYYIMIIILKKNKQIQKQFIKKEQTYFSLLHFFWKLYKMKIVFRGEFYSKTEELFLFSYYTNKIIFGI